MPERRRVRAYIQVERVESRSLLSSTAFLPNGIGGAQAAIALAQIHARQASPTVHIEAASDSESPLQGSGSPTKRERAREQFRAAFAGPVYKGPGRFTDQRSTVYMRGTGSANVFLHGDLNLAVVRPTDPTEPLIGAAVLQDKNVNASNVLALDLTADQSTLDRFGRPTKLSFTTNPNIYSGSFYVANGSGTVTIRYKGNKALAKFVGQIYTIGLTNPERNSDLVSGSGK